MKASINIVDKKLAHLLILGGTADGRKISERLHKQGVNVTYSVAGIVRMPNVSCNIVSGGFSQFGGLENYIKDNNISAILDVTHPYAKTMSTKAVAAAKLCKIPCWRFHRPKWTQHENDHWLEFENWQSLFPALENKMSIFVTVGQLQQETLNRLAQDCKKKIVLRTAVKPKISLPNNVQWIKAIGPFNKKDEIQLMQEHSTDALISKNSGGDSTVAKLHAARDLSVPVFMLTRPILPTADKVFTSHARCEQYLLGELYVI